MSRWGRLRETHTEFGGGRGINLPEAREHDTNTGDASELVFDRLVEMFDEGNVRKRGRLTKLEINERLNQYNPQFGTFVFNPRSHIRPDGGIIEIRDSEGEWRVVLVSEAKRQGTNIERLKEGLGKQASGNAVERMFKNIQEMKNYMIFEPYFPYIVFIFGADFTLEPVDVETSRGNITLEPTSIPDRITAANFGMPINHTYVQEISEKKATSVYARLDTWTVGEMVERMWEVVVKVLDILEEKYGLPE